MTSLATIAMSASLAVGGTYALFTDKADVNVAVSSGSVDVMATVENAKVYSGVWNNTLGDYESVEQADLTFSNDVDGTPSVEFTSNTLKIEKMTPMDKVTFDIRIQNGSTVKASYQTVVSLVDGIELFSGLKVSIGDYDPYDGMTAYSPWAELPTSDVVVPVSIELPNRGFNADTWESENNKYMGKSCEISYGVRTVQGNAYVSDAGTVGSEANTQFMYNDNDFELFARAVENGNDFTGKTVKLMQDVNFGGASTYMLRRSATVDIADYLPIDGEKAFNGTFDGNGKVISGMTIEGDSCVGLFARTGTKAVIKNITLENATISGHHYVGGIVGWATGKVENCVVRNSTITATPNEVVGGYDNGDKVGGIVGYGYYSQDETCAFSISGCTAENVVVNAYRDAGGIIGAMGTKCADCGKVLIENNTATNVTVTADQTVGYYGDKASNVGLVLGRNLSTFPLDASNVGTGHAYRAEGWDYDAESYVLSVYSPKGVVAMNKLMTGDQYDEYDNVQLSNANKAKIEILNDIDMSGYKWDMIDHHVDFGSDCWSVLDGKGHTISNLTINGRAMFSCFAGFDDLLIKDITFDGAKVTSSSINTSILCVQVYQDTTLDNVDVKNSTIQGTYKVAPLVGSVYDEKETTATLTVKNCDISDTTVIATQYDFCTTGMVAFVYEDNNDKVVFENCTISNVKIIAPTTYNYNGHAWVYTTGANNDGSTDGYYNDVDGVIVTGCTFENS